MKPFRVLILDDEQSRHDLLTKKLPNAEITHTYKAWEAIASFLNCKYDVAYLDHDLGEVEDPAVAKLSAGIVNDGMAVVDSMVNNRLSAPTIVVCHSMNPIARKRMYDTLKDNNLAVIERPFSDLIK